MTNNDFKKHIEDKLEGLYKDLNYLSIGYEPNREYKQERLEKLIDSFEYILRHIHIFEDDQ